ncbi:hypothetical protein [Mesorhizobium sp. J428]|uniref:hypothetical protein n=1 Tax=Mesorhizobium sp. J428 TaxID=2898440 RepID=UPI0021515F61|nr:hypothetical protein [Mesorhizobium sp. J428]MCR5860498.1 hypothetical protein [Mesorhizobium sp. J428]
MPDRIATARTLLICLLALALVGFRAPVGTPSGPMQFSTVAHDNHGHSHDEEEQASAPVDHQHDQSHGGDHSHDTPAAAALTSFRFASPDYSGPGMLDDRVVSRFDPPGDRPPRQA